MANGFCQSLELNGALLLGANLRVGNQNIVFDISLKGFGTIHYGDAAAEAGATIYVSQILKRHTVTASGIGKGYEVFALAGIGKNSNLLGASVFENSMSLLFDEGGNGGFNGLGLGFGRELLPGKLEAYTPRRASLLMRFSNAHHSIQLAFRNDFKFGKIVNGQATDYALTGSLLISYASIESVQRAYLLGVGIDLFTPKADYTRTPVNPINSDDGRKNVWFVQPPYQELFYANLYGFYTYQDAYHSLGGSLGMNSQKLGAYIQNTIHDSFGLNPRFPWDVRSQDQLYYELKGSVNLLVD